MIPLVQSMKHLTLQITNLQKHEPKKKGGAIGSHVRIASFKLVT